MSAPERLAALRTHLLPYLTQLDSDVWTLRERDKDGHSILAVHIVPGVLLGGSVEYVPTRMGARHGAVRGQLYALLRDGSFVVLEASGTWDSRVRAPRFRECYEVKPASEEAAAGLPMHVVAGILAQHLTRAGASREAIAATEGLKGL